MKMNKINYSIMCGIILINSPFSMSYAKGTNAYGASVASSAISSEDQVAGNYKYTPDSSTEKTTNSNGGSIVTTTEKINTDSPYTPEIITNETTYDNDKNIDESYKTSSLIYDPINKKTISSPQGFINAYIASDGGSGSTFNSSSDDSSDDSLISYFEGNYVDDVNISNSGANQYLVLYKNYASGASLTNDSGSFFIDSNYAAKATISNTKGEMYIVNNDTDGAGITNSDNAYMYLYNNSAKQTTIDNLDSSSILIDKNDADGSKITNDNSKATITGNSASDVSIVNNNNAIANIYYNTFSANGVITNSNNSTLLSEGNVIDDATVTNDKTSVITVSNCDISSGCIADRDNTTTLTNSNVSNDGKLYLSGNILASGTTIANSGNTYLDNLIMENGSIDNTGSIIVNSESSIGDITNSGTITLNPTLTSAGTVLTVNGDYVGNNGMLSFGTVLGDDDSKTDKLVVTGNASGTTYVSVKNENGAGDQTLEGIELISTGSSTNDAFVQSGRIVAGAYDYHLQKGNASQSSNSQNNWYLTSLLTTPTTPTTPETPTPGVHIWRPEAASYAANLEAANTLFATSLHDRLGETQYTDALTGEKKVTSLWMRNVGGHNKFTMADGQNKTTSNRYVLQLGGDIAQWSSNGMNRFHLGIMGGYANQHSNTTSNLTGYRSKASINGYSAGLYGSWYQNDVNKTGLYMDSWALYNWFSNHVDGEDLSGEKYHSKGMTASVESGYTFHVGSHTTEYGMTNDFYIQPQVQLTWFGVKAKDNTEANGTFVQGTGNNNLQARVGTRFYLKGKSALDKNTGREFEPFVETNWIYNSKQYGTKMDGVGDSSQGSRNMGEVKVGVEGKLTNNINIWTSVGEKIGSDSYRDTEGLLGLKYLF